MIVCPPPLAVYMRGPSIGCGSERGDAIVCSGVAEWKCTMGSASKTTHLVGEAMGQRSWNLPRGQGLPFALSLEFAGDLLLASSPRARFCHLWPPSRLTSSSPKPRALPWQTRRARWHKAKLILPSCWLSQWQTFKLLEITYLLGKLKFKLLFYDPLTD